MHEAAIVQEILSRARAAVPAGGRVVEIRVAVGLLTGVSPDAMAFYFEALRDDTVGAAAQLIVRLEPLRGRCTACGRTVELESVVWLCPSCRAPTLGFENGDELDLLGVVVEDG